MRIEIENIKCKCIVGGSDNLLKFDPINKVRDYLKVRPEGYFHSPKYKNNQWDGYRHFISSKGEFLTGFLPYVVRYLLDSGVQVQLVDLRQGVPVMVPEDEFDIYVGKIDGENWYATGKYAYQADMVKKLHHYEDLGGVNLYFPRGIFDAATNAGKNSMFALILKNLIDPWPAVFMVSNITIYNQAVEFFRQVFPQPAAIGEVRSGKILLSDMLTICMVKTLKNRLDLVNVKMWAQKVRTLGVDESDEAGAKDYSGVLSEINAGVRVHVSGTPLESNKVNNMISIGLSGPVLATITNKELIEKGVSQKPIVKFVLNNMGMLPVSNYDKEEKAFIHECENRAHLVCDILRAEAGKQILVVFENIEHGELMFRTACNEMVEHKHMVIVHGETKDRQDYIDGFKNGDIDIMFASMIVKRGLNMANIQVMVMAQGGKSVTVTKQLSGRGTRHDGESDTVLFYDFYDTGKYLSAHSRKRMLTYKKEGFDVITEYEEYRGKPIQLK